MSAATATEPAAARDGKAPRDQVIVLFGATGDLARRKLLPGIFHLAQVGLMPSGFRLLGTARHAISLDEFRETARRAVEEFGRSSPSREAWDRFADSLRFVGVGDGLGPLVDAVAEARDELAAGQASCITSRCRLAPRPTRFAGWGMPGSAPARG